MVVDLHLHTHFSDGNWSPTKLVEKAIELKFRTIAITDHDSVSGLSEAKEAAKDRLEIIDGIEINTIWINPEGKPQDVHILGYFIDPYNQSLNNLLKIQQNARQIFVKEICARLKQNGFQIEIEDIINCAGKNSLSSLGRPHIAMAMLKSGMINDISSAYKMLMSPESPYCLKRNSVSPVEAIEVINLAGGIASLAHPGKDKYIDTLISELKKANLTAIEAFHRGHSQKIAQKYVKIAKINNLLVTGGSDCHGPYEDFPASIGSVKLSLELLNNLKNKIKNNH